jgi:glycosyltransferase involved in cell wall biosynthesis
VIEILLATYNGEKYLAAQLDSIIRQTHRDWRLLIHDDGSRDGTVSIIKAYQRADPERIVLVEDDVTSVGAKKNFAHLLGFAEADYVMFCDQDDIWLADKVARTLDAMLMQEALSGRSTSTGVFSDLTVVDDSGETVAESGWSRLRVGPWLAGSARRLAVRNCVVGCTMMINRAAMTASMPIPAEAVMHDWWIGLRILKSGGHLVTLREPTVRYRQHGGNTIGAQKFSVVDRIRSAGKVAPFLRSQARVYRMAKRSGAIGNPASFLLAKTYVLARSLARRT